MLANIIRNTKKTAIGGGGGGIVIGGDPYYSAVSLLLPMDGTNGSTTFTDSSLNAATVTVTGDAQISTSQSKYGTAGYFDGTGDYLSIPWNSAYALTGDFTVESWIYPTATPNGSAWIAEQYTGGANTIAWCFGFVDSASAVTTGSKLFFGSYSGAAWSGVLASTGLTLNQWSHVAAVRSGSTLTIYLNGTAVGSGTFSAAISTGDGLYVGRRWDSYVAEPYFQGYLDDLRITKYARYTSAFAPPAQAFPNIYNPYTTLPVSGAALWLDASQQSTLFTDAGTTAVTTSGQSIYQWNDLSGNNRHAVQATSGNRPTWVPPASGQNGLGVANFNGSSSFFDTSMSLNGISSFSVFLVAKSATSGGWQSALRQQSGYQGYFVMPWTSNGGAVSPRIILSYDGGTTTTNTLALTNGVFNLISFIRTSGTSNVANVNGSLSSTRSANSASLSESVNLSIGRYPQPVAEYFSGSIAEIVIFNRALSVSETASVESYLKTKWGTP